MDVFEELSFNLEEIKNMNHHASDFADFCYQACDFYNFDEVKIKKLAELIEADYDLIIRLARKYKDEKKFDYSDSGMSRIKRERYLQRGFDKRKGDQIEALLHVKTIKELVDIIETTGLSKRSMNQITGYLINMYPNTFRKKSLRIDQLFDIYYQYKQNLKKEKKKIEDEIDNQKNRRKAFEFVNVVLSNNDILRIDDIPEKMGIERRDFLQYIKILKEETIAHERVYDLLLKKMKENRKKYYRDKYLDDIYKFLAIVDKPIKVGDNFRLFDLLDCVTYFKNDLPEILDAVQVLFNFNKGIDAETDDLINKVTILKKVLNYYQFEILKTYEGKAFTTDITNENVKKIWKTIIDTHIFLPYTDDLDKRELSDLEKEQVIRLMRLNNLPLSLFYFNLALKRCNGNKLELITKDNIDTYINDSKKEKK